MMEIDAVLESYRNADAETREDLFFQYRDLRPLFDRIDAEQTPAPAGRTADVAAKRRAGFALLRRPVRRTPVMAPGRSRP